MPTEHYDVSPLPGLDPQIGLIAAMLQDATRDWREELGEVPDELVTWQPYPGGHSVGAVLLHMIDCEAGWLERIALGRERDPEELATLRPSEPPDENSYIVPPSLPYAWYLGQYDKVRARSLQTLAQFRPPEASIKHPRFDATFTLRWIASHIVAHEAYHGGQMVLLKELFARAKSQQ